MHRIGPILAGFALLLGAVILLRLRWWRFSSQIRRRITVLAPVPILIFGLAYVTHVSTVWDRLDAAAYWAAVAGYLVLLSLHTLMRPRWLTVLTAAVLASPLLFSSFFLPLGAIFNPYPRRTTRLADNLYLSLQHYEEWSERSSGTAVDVYSHPRLLPFLRRSQLSGRFPNTRCNAESLDLHLGPDHRSVFVRCPPWPGSTSETEEGELVPLH